MTGPHIVPARHEDLDLIMGLETIGFEQAEQWSRRSWLGELDATAHTVLLARTHRTVGVITLQTAQPTADLHRLVVAPAARRTGVATALVLAGAAAVAHKGARAVMLEVRYDNEPAIALYQKLGFEQLAMRPDYYGPGVHALVLRLWDLTLPARVVSGGVAEDQR